MEVPAAKIVFPEDERKKILEKMDGILSSGQLTLGKYGKEFEEKFAPYSGCKYGIAVNSGTSALEIILRSINIQGRDVIVPTNTFIATAAAALHAGANVIFSDIFDNLCIDINDVKKRLTPKTKAIIVVHIGGIIPPQIEELNELCIEKNIYLIEDAAHAHGSSFKGKMAGSFGKAAAFSFYPTKVMTSGEGGMITTNDEEIYKRAQVFRDQGKAGFYQNIHTELGYNWRMSEIHAVLGLSQFALLERFLADRRRIAAFYDKHLSEIRGLKEIHLDPNVKSNYYKYPVLLDSGQDRQKLKKDAKEKYGVGLSGEVYELPCHLQPVFKEKYGFKGGEFPNAERLCKTQICFPVFAGMTDGQAQYVIETLRTVA